MRFQGSGKTGYLGRRDQFRLLTMVAMTGFVVISIQYAAQPSTWYWLTGQPDPTADRARESDINFAPHSDPNGELPLGVVRIAEARPESAPRPPALATELRNAAAGEFKLTPEQLDQIQNNTVGVRVGERDLYYELLARVRETSLSKLEEAGRPDLAFAALMSESEKFLGQLVTVKGEIRGLRQLPAGANEHGITDVWEAWLFNRDSGQNPFVIRCTSIPDGIPTGMELPSGIVVSASGYFFKRYGYPAQEFRLHTAPLILTKTVRWYRPEESGGPATDHGLIPYVLGFAVFLIATLSFTLWRFRVGDREFEQQHLKRLTAASPESIAALESLPMLDVSASLQEFARSFGSPDENGPDENGPGENGPGGS